MKNSIRAAIFLVFIIAVPISAFAEVNVSIGISLPPLVVFQAPPQVVVIPDTIDVYVVPDIDVDIYFWNGWWWRPWGGRWYRSRNYDRNWVYYDAAPSFYFDIDLGWRDYYRARNWHGHRWEYERIPYDRLQKNWKNWKRNKHWEKQKRWGVQSYQARPQSQRQILRRERQEQYRQRPEVQRHQQEMRARQKEKRAQTPQREPRKFQGQQREQSEMRQPRQQPQKQRPARPQQSQPQEKRQHRGDQP